MGTNVTDAGCAKLVSALDSGMMPAFKQLYLDGASASAAAQQAVQAAIARRAAPGAAS